MGKKIGGLDSFFLEPQTIDQIEEPVKKAARTVKTTSESKAEAVAKDDSGDKQEQAKAKKKDEDIRATFIVNPKRLDQLKAIAYWDRAKIKDIHDAALEMYIESRSDIPQILAKRKR